MKSTHRLICWPVALCIFLATTLSLRSTDITWINGAGGDWNTAANWNPSQVPGPADKAILALGVTVTVDADTTVGSVDFSNGALSGTGSLTVNGALSWTGGDMSGSGTTVIPSGGSLVLSGANNKLLGQRTINSSGTTSLSGGDLWSGQGAVFNNTGTFDVEGDASFLNNLGGSATINNTGSFQKSGGTGSTAIGPAFNNNGTLNVQTGTITMAGSSFSNSTTAVLQGSGTVDVSHTTFTTDGTFSPGNPLGALLVTGNLPQSTNGVINIQIGGTNAGVNYDQLIVTGSATLNGALNISLVNGFRPSGGDTFEIIKYASHTGSFNNISGLDLGGGFFLEPAFGSTNLILTTIDNRPRPQLSPPQRLPNGEIRITLTGVAGQTFVIQATTNLVSWDAVLTNVNSGAVFDLIITDSSFYPYRFYRTFQP